MFHEVISPSFIYTFICQFILINTGIIFTLQTLKQIKDCISLIFYVSSAQVHISQKIEL